LARYVPKGDPVQLSILALEPLTHAINPLPAKCQCGAVTGTFRFLAGTVVGLTCDGCGKRLAPNAVRLYPLRKPCTCGAALGALGFVAPLGPHQSLYCLACGAWNWHVSRADLATK